MTSNDELKTIPECCGMPMMAHCKDDIVHPERMPYVDYWKCNICGRVAKPMCAALKIKFKKEKKKDTDSETLQESLDALSKEGLIEEVKD